MKILILGHNGFIGHHLIIELSDLFPNSEVHGLSRPYFNINDINSIKNSHHLFTPDSIVIMCLGVKKQKGDNLGIYKENMRIIENFSDLISQKPVKQIIYMSSAEVYGEGPKNERIVEDSPIQLKTYYGIAKFSSEVLLKKTCESLPKTVLTILRPPLVYGIGDSTKGYGPSGFFEAYMHDHEIILWGDGEELREFLYIKDLISIVYYTILLQSTGIINPVSGISRSFSSILTILTDIFKKTPKTIIKERNGEKVDIQYTNEKLRSLIPHFSFTPLEKGLKEMMIESNYQRICQQEKK